MASTTEAAQKDKKGIVAAITSYFTDTKFRYTEADVEASKYILFGRGKFSRNVLILPAILSQICAGSFYAWSVVSSSLTNIANEIDKKNGGQGDHTSAIYKDTKNTANYAFYMCIIFFGVASCFTGPFLERRGPKIPAVLGATLFFIGNIICTLGLTDTSLSYLWTLMIGYGLFVGSGIGMAYITPVAVLQKWYPERRGLAAGISVGAFGFGSFLAGLWNEEISKAFPNDPMYLFLIPGCLSYMVQLPSAFLMRFPIPSQNSASTSDIAKHEPQGEIKATASIKGDPTVFAAPVASPVQSSSEDGHACSNDSTAVAALATDEDSLSLMQSVFSFRFFLVFLLEVTACMAGLTLVSRAKDLAESLYNEESLFVYYITPIMGVFNVIGRFVIAAASDKLGRVIPLIGTLVLQIVVLTLILFATKADDGSLNLKTNTTKLTMFASSTWLLIMCYGAVLGVVPGLLGDMFGTGNVGALYGISLLGWSLSGVITGFGIKTLIAPNFQPGGLDDAIYILYAVICVGIAAALCVAYIVRQARVKAAAIAASKYAA